MDEPPVIDHNPDERRPGYGLYWAAWIVVALLWFAQWFKGFEWDQLLLGLGTGCILACWAIEITGNKVPETWKSAARKKRR